MLARKAGRNANRSEARVLLRELLGIIQLVQEKLKGPGVLRRSLE